MKRDGVCNPVTHILKAIKAVKRFGRGYKPRPASWNGCAIQGFHLFCIFRDFRAFRGKIVN